MLRIGIELVPDKPVSEIVELAKLAEQVGFDHIWVTDHYNNRNLWCTLTAIALNTSRVKIGPGVTNPYHTNPALSTAAAVTMNEISGGRAVVGLGAGDRVTLGTLGLKRNKPVSTVVDGMIAIRALTEGKTCTMEGRAFALRGARLDSVKKVPLLDAKGRPVVMDGRPVLSIPKMPIYAGVQGPSMMRNTAAVADGLLINASHPIDFRAAMGRIREGVKKAGKNIKDLDIGAYTAFSIADSREKAMGGHTKLVVAYILAGAPRTVLASHQVEQAEAEEIAKLLQDGKFKEAQNRVDDTMVDAFAIVGGKDYCIERIEQLVDEGVTHFIAGSPLGPDRTSAIRQIGEEIILHFRRET